MVLFNYSTKEITAKIVYYGPGLCGKTTNLQFIYENLPKSINKGKMLSLATKTDRTLFFDFLPIDLGTIRGMRTRLQLYTVPGQVFYNTTRKLVLKGADGIVFVADSQKRMIDANLESFKNLEENLTEHGMNLSEIPLIIQFNKRDLPEVATIEELNSALNKFNVPIYEAVATTGIGVHETLKAMTRLVLNSLKSRYAEKRGQRSLKAPPAAPSQERATQQVSMGMPEQSSSPGPLADPSPAVTATEAIGQIPSPPEPAVEPASPEEPLASMPSSAPETAATEPEPVPAEPLASMQGTLSEPAATMPEPDGEAHGEAETDEDDVMLLEVDDDPVLELVDEGLDAILEDEGVLGAKDDDALVASEDIDLFDEEKPRPDAIETAVRVPPSDSPEPVGSEEEPASPFADMEPASSGEEPASPFADMEPVGSEKESASPFADMEPITSGDEPASPFADMEPITSEEEPASPFADMEPAGIVQDKKDPMPGRPEAASRHVAGDGSIPTPPEATSEDQSPSRTPSMKSSTDQAPATSPAMEGSQQIMLPINLAIGDQTISFQLKISLDIAPGGELKVARIEGGR